MISLHLCTSCSQTGPFIFKSLPPNPQNESNPVFFLSFFQAILLFLDPKNFQFFGNFFVCSSNSSISSSIFGKMRQILDSTKIGKENPDFVQFSFSFFEQFF
jgi:hypothetical protein